MGNVLFSQHGSKNVKPDALSRLFERGDCSPETSVMPISYVIGSLNWSIGSQVLEALKSCLAPDKVPPNRLFAPAELRGKFISWDHDSLFSCHPGVCRTVFQV